MLTCLLPSFSPSFLPSILPEADKHADMPACVHKNAHEMSRHANMCMCLHMKGFAEAFVSVSRSVCLRAGVFTSQVRAVERLGRAASQKASGRICRCPALFVYCTSSFACSCTEAWLQTQMLADVNCIHSRCFVCCLLSCTYQHLQTLITTYTYIYIHQKYAYACEVLTWSMVARSRKCACKVRHVRTCSWGRLCVCVCMSLYIYIYIYMQLLHTRTCRPCAHAYLYVPQKHVCMHLCMFVCKPSGGMSYIYAVVNL